MFRAANSGILGKDSSHRPAKSRKGLDLHAGTGKDEPIQKKLNVVLSWKFEFATTVFGQLHCDNYNYNCPRFNGSL